METVVRLYTPFKGMSVQEVAQHEGISVVERELPQEIRALYLRAESGKYIVLSKGLSAVTADFIIAHQLYRHLRLDGRITADVFLLKRTPSQEECRASVFASLLAKPRTIKSTLVSVPLQAWCRG